MGSRDVRKVIESYLEGWRSGDRDAWLALFADHARLVDPVGKPAHEGKAAIGAFWDGLHRVPMTFRPEVRRIAVCGNRAMLDFAMHALGPDGSGMAVDVVDIFQLTDDYRIESLEAYWDSRCMRPVLPAAS